MERNSEGFTTVLKNLTKSIFFFLKIVGKILSIRREHIILSRKIIKVTKTEFTTADGKVHPMVFDLDEVPTVKEFQERYDEWFHVFREKRSAEIRKQKKALEQKQEAAC